MLRSARDRSSRGRDGRKARRAADEGRLRALIVSSILADPLSELTDPTVRDRLVRGDGDITFAELGLDSLARLTLAANLDAEHGYPVSEAEVAEAGSIERLVTLLSALPRRAITDGGESDA